MTDGHQRPRRYAPAAATLLCSAGLLLWAAGCTGSCGRAARRGDAYDPYAYRVGGPTATEVTAGPERPIRSPQTPQTPRRRTPLMAVASRAEPAWRQDLRERLAVRVSADFDGVALKDVLAWCRQRGGVNVVLDPRVDAAQPVDLQVRRMKLATVLGWVERLCDLHRSYRNEALYLSPEPAGDGVLRAYPVGELAHGPRDAYAPGLGRDEEEEDAVAEDFFDQLED
jgi:hypothetical protein